eukprot:snap_masked-scaffold_60-processed-gene-0.12-mRNA-1 protein AED:1.00 eAED:1.00 QI:0/-1/0/0/-1/1/1/0/315
MAEEIGRLLKHSKQLLQQGDFVSAGKFLEKLIADSTVFHLDSPSLCFQAVEIIFEYLDFTENSELEEISLKLADNVIQKFPKFSYKPYFILASYEFGKDSLSLYQMGLSLLEPNVGNSEELKKSLSSAYSSIADLYLTDLCFEANAQSECLKHLKLAEQALDGNLSAEVLQLFSSYFISSQEKEKSIIYLRKLYQKTKEYHETLTKSLSMNQPKVEEMNLDFRLNTVRMLMEVKLDQLAAELLKDMQLEEDENLDLILLFAQANANLSRKEEAIHCVEKAESLLNIFKSRVNQSEVELFTEHENILNRVKQSLSL